MNREGFTLTEVVMALGIFGMVSAGAIGVYLTCSKTWYRTDVEMRVMKQLDLAMQKLTYGVGGTNGLRTAISTNVVIFYTNDNWMVTYKTPDNERYRFRYDRDSSSIHCTNLVGGGREVPIATQVVGSMVTGSIDGITFTIQVGIQDGKFAATNSATSFVHYRN